MIFSISFILSLGTFLSLFGLSSAQPIIVYIILFGVNGLMLVVYVLTQIILVVNTLDDRWPLGEWMVVSMDG